MAYTDELSLSYMVDESTGIGYVYREGNNKKLECARYDSCRNVDDLETRFRRSKRVIHCYDQPNLTSNKPKGIFGRHNISRSEMIADMNLRWNRHSQVRE